MNLSVCKKVVMSLMVIVASFSMATMHGARDSRCTKIMVLCSAGGAAMGAVVLSGAVVLDEGLMATAGGQEHFFEAFKIVAEQIGPAAGVGAMAGGFLGVSISALKSCLEKYGS